jgi:uncharacterized membrane protein
MVASLVPFLSTLMREVAEGTTTHTAFAGGNGKNTIRMREHVAVTQPFPIIILIIIIIILIIITIIILVISILIITIALAFMRNVILAQNVSCETPFLRKMFRSSRAQVSHHTWVVRVLEPLR